MIDTRHASGKRAGGYQALDLWDFDRAPRTGFVVEHKVRRIGTTFISQNAGGRTAGCRRIDYRLRRGASIIGLGIVVEGGGKFIEENQTISCRKGDVWVVNGRNPLNFTVDNWSRTFVLIMPADSFEMALHSALPTNVAKFSACSSLGAVVSAFMASLAENMENFDDRAAEAGIRMAKDVIASAMDANAPTLEDGRKSSLYDRILDYIDRRIHHMDLTPDAISSAHGLSRRALDRLFSNNDVSVAGYIRERRLLHCREELNRLDGGRSLVEIAHRWGFSDSAHFSRSFKKRFGLPPKAWRDSLEEI